MKHFIIIGPDTTTEFDIKDEHVLIFRGDKLTSDVNMKGNGDGIFNRQVYTKPAIPMDERDVIYADLQKIFAQKVSVKKMMGDEWKIKFEMYQMSASEMKRLSDAGYEIRGFGGLNGKYGYNLEVYVEKEKS